MMLINFLAVFRNSYFPYSGSRPTSAACRDPRPGIEDYQQIVNTTLYFSDAQHLQTFGVMIFEDAVPEDVEELNVTIILDPTTSIGIVGERVSVTPAVATVRIRDNDCKFDCHLNWWVHGLVKKCAYAILLLKKSF